MRSPREILFRLFQEIRNIAFYVHTPRWTAGNTSVSFPGFPDPHLVANRLQDEQYSEELIATADKILAHSFPLFGTSIQTGPDIEWRRDYLSNITTGLSFFRRIPYLDAQLVGDHKVIWELNRHQHLVLLAQAYLLSKRESYLREIEIEIGTWCQQNPFVRGINWASALEVAFRANSWLWVLHLVGSVLDHVAVGQITEGLHQHGIFLENNLSYYFAPNTHLLGEGVVLYALGRALPGHPKSKTWMLLGSAVVESHMHDQVQGDGSYFEQSTYYHVYAMDMFLFYSCLAETTEEFRAKLWKMAEYLEALLGHDRRLPFFGDDDGGRWFHPYGARDQFGRATLATCNILSGRQRWQAEPSDLYPQACWWTDCSVGPVLPSRRTTTFFTDSGSCVLQDESCKAILDAGPFGGGSAGHSHADTLSLTVTAGDEEVLVDAGTFTYVADLKLRDQFRGTSAHNTVRINGRDQADLVNPFRWANPPAVRIINASAGKTEDRIEAECSYRGFVHKRKLRFIKPLVLYVMDEVTGPPGQHLLECFWHLGTESAQRRFVFSHPARLVRGYRSRCFGQQEAIFTWCVQIESELPARFATAIVVDDNSSAEILISRDTLDLQITDYSETRSFSF